MYHLTPWAPKFHHAYAIKNALNLCRGWRSISTISESYRVRSYWATKSFQSTCEAGCTWLDVSSLLMCEAATPESSVRWTVIRQAGETLPIALKNLEEVVVSCHQSQGNGWMWRDPGSAGDPFCRARTLGECCVSRQPERQVSGRPSMHPNTSLLQEVSASTNRTPRVTFRSRLSRLQCTDIQWPLTFSAFRFRDGWMCYGEQSICLNGSFFYDWMSVRTLRHFQQQSCKVRWFANLNVLLSQILT